jgi:ABC-type branched-subunit amino acid transport system substrate-binding protein
MTAFVTASILSTVLLGAAVFQDYRTRGQQQSVPASATADNSGDSSPGATDSGATGATTTTGNAGVTGGSTSNTTTSGGGGAPSGLSNNQASSGVRGGKIYVGGIYDMTGPVDSSVERDTVRAYFDKVNAAGGINGQQLVLVACDGHYDPVVSHNCSNQMVDSQVLAMVGNTFPRAEDQEVPFLAGQEKIPLVGGLGTPAEYQQALSYPVSPSFAFGGQALAALFKQNQAHGGFKHPAIIYINDVPWVQPVLKQIEEALQADGIVPTHVEPASATNDPDYSQHVANMASQSDYTSPDGSQHGSCASPPEEAGFCPDSIIAATDPFSYAKLFQAMDRVNWHPPVVAGGLDKGNQQVAYGDQLERAQSITPFVSPLDPAQSGNATSQDYLSTVRHYYPNQVPALDVYTQIAWTAAALFVQAAKNAGPNLTRATLVAALNKLQNFDTGWSTPLSYSPGDGHDPSHCYYFMTHDSKPASQGGTWREDGDPNPQLHCY